MFMKVSYVILGSIIVAFALVAIVTSNKKQNSGDSGGIVCTMEAKLCPDGSAVGRSGPKCEFAPCPGEGKGGGRVAAGYVVGHVSIGPFCPVEQIGHPCTVPPEAYSSRKVIVYEANGTTVKEKDAIDSDGNYKITLGPGTYWLQIDPAGIGPGEKKQVTIISFATSTVDFDIDTGIR